MKMRNCTFIAAGVVLGNCVLNTTSHGQVLLEDNFDSYANQAAFEAAWTPIGTTAPISGILSTEQALSLSNSIKIPGTATNGQYRNRRLFAETGVATAFEPIVFSIDFYDSFLAGTPGRNYANLQDTTGPSGTNQLISLGLNNTQLTTESGGNFYMARILGYTPPVTDPDGGPDEKSGLGSGAYFKLNDFGVGLRSEGWHNLKVEITSDDGVSTDYAFYVDNVLAERVSNVGAAGSLRSYDNVTLGSAFSNSSTDAYFDNVSVAVVPEPSSSFLIAMSLLGFAARRRR